MNRRCVIAASLALMAAFQGVVIAAGAAPDNSLSPVRIPPTRRVLYIGDSLSVGDFGQAMQMALIAGSARSRVAVYASCGSAAQHWLESEPRHITTCGYRETTSSKKILEDFHNGEKPQPMPTPKIEPLIRKHKPDIIIVQLGTNHFDSVQTNGKAALPGQEDIFERFARALQGTTREAPQVIWILPPDTPHFSKTTQSAIADLITKVAKRHRFQVIDSKRFTRYVMGKTGTDGIHYSGESSLIWATAVIKEMNKLFLPRVHFGS